MGGGGDVETAGEGDAGTGFRVTGSPGYPVIRDGPVLTTPFVRKRARDLGIDLAQVPGTGPDGRITEADLEAFHTALASRKTAASQADESEGAVRATPFVRKRAGAGYRPWRGNRLGPHGRISEEDLTAFAQARSVPPATLEAAPVQPRRNGGG
jgi:pyruvate/2-oxoglutarate dehydrogenase complex dihydrolipoamide acyltransferase (E2) component